MNQMIERFWAYVKVGGPDECWEWQASRCPSGYGHFRDGKSGYAHRFAFELATGSEPGDKWILHRCDNPPCVNPAHLFSGSPLDNVKDRDQKGRTFRKLTDAQVVELRQRARSGESQRRLGAEYGVDQSWVSRVSTGQRRAVKSS